MTIELIMLEERAILDQECANEVREAYRQLARSIIKAELTGLEVYINSTTSDFVCKTLEELEKQLNDEAFISSRITVKRPL